MTTANSSKGDQQQQILRPTEAQLRWAQFHRKGRVERVKESVERLYQTPASVSDVEGAFPDDGNTTTTEAGSDYSGNNNNASPRRRRKKRPSRKPKISRGRRAMLRVSKRAYERRRVQIEAEGYACWGHDKENELEEDEEDDELAAMFEEHVVTRRRKWPRKSRAHQDEERVRRFEAAYRAMMNNLLQPDETPEPIMDYSSKRWKPIMPTGAQLSIDGLQYDDLKWGFTSRKTSMSTRVVASPATPVDRRASWLVHLPLRQPSSSTLLLKQRYSASPRGQLTVKVSGAGGAVPTPPVLSPGKAKFDELVARMQNPRKSFATLDPSLISPRSGLTGSLADDMASPSGSTAARIRKLSQSMKEPFLEKQPNESQQEFERRLEYFEKQQQSRPTRNGKSQPEFDERKEFFEKRSNRRLSQEKREHFFQVLQAPYENAAKPQQPRKRNRTGENHVKKLSKERSSRFSQEPKRQKKRAPKFDAAKVPKLSRKPRAEAEDQSVHDENQENDLKRSSISNRVGGLLNMFSPSKSDKEPSRQSAFQRLSLTIFSPAGSQAETSDDSPVARFRSFFSGGKQSSVLSQTAVVHEESEEDEDDEIVEDHFAALRKYVAGKEDLTESDNEKAITAYEKLVSGKDLNQVQHQSFQKFVSGKEFLNPDEASHAATAYRKVIAGSGETTATQEAAIRKMVSGEEVSQEDAMHALEGYRKLVAKKKTAVSVKEQKSSRQSSGMSQKENDKEIFDALCKFTTGVNMTPIEEKHAQEAVHTLISGRNMKWDEEDACIKLMSGQELTSREEEQASLAFRKIVSGAAVNNTEQQAFRKVVRGQALSREEAKEALKAYTKVNSSQSHEVHNADEVGEEQFFDAFRNLASGADMSPEEEMYAKVAVHRITHRSKISSGHEDAYIKLVSRQPLSAREEELATLAHRQLVSSLAMEEEEVEAFRKVAWGEELSEPEAIEALKAYRKVTSSKASTGRKEVFTRTDTTHRSQDDETDEDDDFDALRKLAAGMDMTTGEEKHARVALHKMVSGRKMSTNCEDAYVKLVYGHALTTKEEDLAVTAYRQVVSGRSVTGREEASIRKMIWGEELSREEATQALKAYRKITSSKQRSDNVSHQDREENDSDEEEDFFHALRKLAAGMEMSPEEEKHAQVAVKRMISKNQMAPDREEAYVRMVSGQELTPQEEELAISAYRQVISAKAVDGTEESVMRKMVFGEELSEEEAVEALKAYRKITRSKRLGHEKDYGPKPLYSSYEEDSDDEEEEDFFAALRKLAAGMDLTPTEETFAQVALHNLTREEDMPSERKDALIKLVTGQELTAEEDDLAVSTYRQVISGKVAGKEEAAIRKMVWGEELSKEEATEALKAYRKLVRSKPGTSQMDAKQETRSRLIEEDDKADFYALRKLAMGAKMTGTEQKRSQNALEKMIADKQMTHDEEDAYAKLVSGVELTAQEEDLAVLAYQKLVLGRNLNEEEEVSYGRLVSGEELNGSQEKQALVAYKKLTSAKKVLEDEITAENEETVFAALTKLTSGAEMTHQEDVHAALAYKKLVTNKELDRQQESAFRMLVSGEKLQAAEIDRATEAYRTVVSGAPVTNDQEAAFRKVVIGDSLTDSETVRALKAFKALVSSRSKHEKGEQVKAGSLATDDNDCETDSSASDEEDCFDALRKLAAGYELSPQEDVKAATAYQMIVTGKQMTNEEDVSFRKLVSGEDLTPEDEDFATAGYRKVIQGKQLSDQEEAAYRKLIAGKELSNGEEGAAFAAFKTLAFEGGSDEESDDEEDFFDALRKLAFGEKMSLQEEVRATAAYQKMVSGKNLSNKEDVAYRKLVTGDNLTPDDEDQAMIAYRKMISSKLISEPEEKAYGKLVSGEELSHAEEASARKAYRKLVSGTAVKLDIQDVESDDEDEDDFFDALRKLAAGFDMNELEETKAATAYQKMVSGKQMTSDEDTAYRKLVSGLELSAEEEDFAVAAYRKLVFDKGLNAEEENAYGKLVSGEDLINEEEARARSAYRKLVSSNHVTEDKTARDVTALHKLASGQPVTETEEFKAVAAYQGMIAGKGLTQDEDACYRKLVCGAELSEEEQDLATAAYHKVLGDKELSPVEEMAYRKLVSGQAFNEDEQSVVLSTYHKVVSAGETKDEDSFSAALSAYEKFVGGEQLTDEEELRAVAAFKRLQEERRENDETASTASFRVLPEGIRRVVQSFASPEPAVNTEDVEELEPRGESLGTEQPDGALHFSSPSRSGVTRSNSNDLSPEHVKIFHQKVMESSALIGEGETDQTIIDTDETTSDASGAKMDPKMAASLLLSPTILTKRHQQAIRAIEKRKWDQVSYILHANPWLAEMMDVVTNQYLLHKLSFYGASVADVDPKTGEATRVEAPASPDQLNTDLIRMFPSSVHKFDQDGNLPLHMAAASGNLAMIKLLGERFPSGASVRNNDGFLPLHLVIMSCSSPVTAAGDEALNAAEGVKQMVKLFPGAVAVTDNEGNLPLHTAASALQGDVGVDVIYMLLDEADRQVNSASGIRFVDFKPKPAEDDSVNTDVTSAATDSETLDGETVYCTMVRNNHGHNPLVTAIRSMAGWEIVEAIVGGNGGKRAALHPDANMCNSLHLLLSGEFADPPSVLSILKAVPQTATIRNREGLLPIETACMQQMPREVILALVLVDLPIDLDDKEGFKVRDGFGDSWWFLTCECDDHHVDIVEEVISICSYNQIRELCFMKGGRNRNSGTVISRATPKSRLQLRKALRFVGRFEFLGSSALHADSSRSLKVFEALDFGTEEFPIEDGRRVLLYCYGNEDSCRNETTLLRDHEFDDDYVEEVFDFAVHEMDNHIDEGAPRQFCVVVERPNLTLDKVVASMSSSKEYQLDSEMRGRYLTKVTGVLRFVAKCVRHLHSVGIVHGKLCTRNCGKFDDQWKLMGVMESHGVGAVFDPSAMGESSPPESVEALHNIVETHFARVSSRRVTYKSRMVAEISIDIWGFGKLAYEALTGESLVQFDVEKETRQDNRAPRTLLKWDESNLRQVMDTLERAGVSSSGIDLIARCLLPNPIDRPSSMTEILEHAFWNDMRRKSTSRSPQSRRSHRRR